MEMRHILNDGRAFNSQGRYDSHSPSTRIYNLDSYSRTRGSFWSNINGASINTYRSPQAIEVIDICEAMLPYIIRNGAWSIGGEQHEGKEWVGVGIQISTGGHNIECLETICGNNAHPIMSPNQVNTHVFENFQFG